MLISLLAVSAIVPSALLVWYFHARDVYPEPPRVLWTTFGIGVLSVLPVLAIGLPLQAATSSISDPLMASLLSALFVAAVLEELAKLSVLVGYNMRQKAFDEPMDGIVYGVVASLGFATLENVLFVFEGGLSVALSRAFSAVPLHAFVGAIMGYYVGQAYFNPGRRLRIILTGYGIAVLLHALYDFPLMAMAEVEDVRIALALALVTLLVLLVCWRWTIRIVRRLHREQLIASAEREGADAVMSVPRVAPPLHTRMGHLLVAFVGGTMASFGGMVTLGLSLAFIIGAVQREHSLDVLIGGTLIGLVPLAVGIAIFRMGIRGMNVEVPAPVAANSSVV
ncbi:MAG: hypothetical protein H6Q31_718 [Bacteroidetes bacterium]|jgi:RsiW-degrading membrane proteinase PrsW (M82 family)|nr:hypothetical protein [Bacteroidota bacterium]